MKKRIVGLLILFSMATGVGAWAAIRTLNERLQNSGVAFDQMMRMPEGAPTNLIRNCEAIIIFPKTLNIAWGIGGQYGKGVAVRRDPKTGRWGKPAFYSIGGLTIGPQIGGQAIDIILVVANEKGLKSLLESKCTLGGDAGIAVGPAGRNATASTDLGLKAEIYSYARARGLYIGLSLKGAVVSPDKDANAEYHGRGVTTRDILLYGKGQSTSADRELMKALNRWAPPKAMPLSWILWGILIAGLAAVGFLFLKKKKK